MGKRWLESQSKRPWREFAKPAWFDAFAQRVPNHISRHRCKQFGRISEKKLFSFFRLDVAIGSASQTLTIMSNVTEPKITIKAEPPFASNESIGIGVVWVLTML